MLCNGFLMNIWQIEMERSPYSNTLLFNRNTKLSLSIGLLLLFPALVQGADSLYDQQILQARQGQYAPFLSYLQQYQLRHALTPSQVADWLQVALWAGQDDEVVKVWRRYQVYMPIPARGTAAAAQALRNQKQWQTSLTLWQQALSQAPGSDDYRIGYIKTLADAREDGEVEPEEESMLLGILRFNDLQVQDTMTPRTDIDCVPEDMLLPEVARVIVESGHSRIPVFRDTRDNMVGMLHAKDILSCLLDPKMADQPASAIMREPFFVPETKPIRNLLQEFRASKQHIAIALDEYGGTSGLITIEDLLEEIVGDIEDEHDAPREEDIRPLGAHVYELTGRALLEDLEELGVDLSSDEVDTIGGYLSMEAGHVPAPGEVFILRGWRFEVLDADKKLIRHLRMEPARKNTPDASETED